MVVLVVVVVVVVVFIVFVVLLQLLQLRLLQLGFAFPDLFFHSRESGMRKLHSRDSRSPGNEV